MGALVVLRAGGVPRARARGPRARGLRAERLELARAARAVAHLEHGRGLVDADRLRRRGIIATSPVTGMSTALVLAVAPVW